MCQISLGNIDRSDPAEPKPKDFDFLTRKKALKHLGQCPEMLSKINAI
jgi:hypothetical protein